MDLAGETRTPGAHPRVCQKGVVRGGWAQGVCPRGVPQGCAQGAHPMGAPGGNQRCNPTTNVQLVWVGVGCKDSAGSTGFAKGGQGQVHKAGVPTQEMEQKPWCKTAAPSWCLV